MIRLTSGLAIIFSDYSYLTGSGSAKYIVKTSGFFWTKVSFLVFSIYLYVLCLSKIQYGDGRVQMPEGKLVNIIGQTARQIPLNYLNI